MNIYKILSIVAGIVFTLAFVPYIRAILKKQTKPAKASWIIWASLDVITFIGMAIKGTINGQIAAAIICASSVVILAMIYGEKRWTKLDKFCLAGALLGVVLWIAFRDAIFGIIVSQVVIFLGSFPTFKNAWQHPDRENKAAWMLYWLSCFPAIGTASHKLTLESLAQPVNFLIVESVMVYLLFIRRRPKL